MFDTCVILAGGRGERLRPLTNFLPKPLIPVNGVSIIQLQIEYLRQYGVHNFIILSGYLADSFDNLCDYYASQSHIRVQNIISPPQFLTLERLHTALVHISGDFLLLYGDNYAEVDLSTLYRQYISLPESSSFYSVLAPRRISSKSTQRVFNEDIKLFNPYHTIRPCTTDIGFFCGNSSTLSTLIYSEPNLSQKFEDWYFRHEHITRKYFIHYWDFLSLTDLSSLSEASSCLTQSPVLFLDRDGVLIHSRTSSKYITDIHDIVFNDTFINSLKTFAGSLSDIVIITNQPWSSDLTDDYKRISSYVESRLKQILSFDRISTYTCSHKITHRCLCRKPKPGLVLQYLENRSHPYLNNMFFL